MTNQTNQNNDILINESGNSIEAIEKSSALDESASSEDREVVEEAKTIIGRLYPQLGTLGSRPLLALIAIAERDLEVRTCETCNKAKDCLFRRVLMEKVEFEVPGGALAQTIRAWDDSQFGCNFHEKKQE